MAVAFVLMLDFITHHLPAITALALFAERLREVFTKREVVGGRKTESLTFRLFMVCGALIVLGGIAEYYLHNLRLSWPTFLIGLSISVASFILRRAAIRALGRFWSLHVEMREGHEFVQTGPFACARHPVYSSMVLEILGIGLILNAWITLAVVFSIFVPTMVARVRMEEAALLEQFGERYEEYKKRIPAIIPKLSRRGTT